MAVMQSRLRELKKRFCLIATINSTQQILHMSGEAGCPKGQGKRVCVCVCEEGITIQIGSFNVPLRAQVSLSWQVRL